MIRGFLHQALSDPFGESAGQVFTNGTMADLLVTRNASGLFSAYAPILPAWAKYAFPFPILLGVPSRDGDSVLHSFL
jgi:hypothetical protein